MSICGMSGYEPPMSDLSRCETSERVMYGCEMSRFEMGPKYSGAKFPSLGTRASWSEKSKCGPSGCETSRSDMSWDETAVCVTDGCEMSRF